MVSSTFPSLDLGDRILGAHGSSEGRAGAGVCQGPGGSIQEGVRLDDGEEQRSERRERKWNRTNSFQLNL